MQGKLYMEHCLIGKTIIAMNIASDGLALQIITSDKEEIIVRVDGDCCSHTWIEHVQLPPLGFPALVTDVDELTFEYDDPPVEEPFNSQMEDNEYGEYDDDDDDYEYDDSVIVEYGCAIRTLKGDILIEYRNSSNGYYGGNLCWPGDYFYGGVHGQNISNNQWVEISEC